MSGLHGLFPLQLVTTGNKPPAIHGGPDTAESPERPVPTESLGSGPSRHGGENADPFSDKILNDLQERVTQDRDSRFGGGGWGRR